MWLLYPTFLFVISQNCVNIRFGKSRFLFFMSISFRLYVCGCFSLFILIALRQILCRERYIIIYWMWKYRKKWCQENKSKQLLFHMLSFEWKFRFAVNETEKCLLCIWFGIKNICVCVLCAYVYVDLWCDFDVWICVNMNCLRCFLW